MTNDEKMKIFEDQVLKVSEALTKFFDEAGEKLMPVFEAVAKAAAVCEANKIDVAKERKTCEECAYFERTENGAPICVEDPSCICKMTDTVPCNHFEPAQDATEATETHDFKEGELIVYVKGTTAQIGEIKRICDEGAFVYYHIGDTASLTPFENMHKLQNAYCIKQTSLALYRPRCGSCKHFSECTATTDIETTTDASNCREYEMITRRTEP